jgi:hypothetical protein
MHRENGPGNVQHESDQLVSPVKVGMSIAFDFFGSNKLFTLTVHRYIEELLAYQYTLFYLQDGALAVFLWRGTYPITLGPGKTIHLPAHSFTAFLCATLLVEFPQLFPCFIFASLAWIMLASNGYRSNLPDQMNHCKSFAEFVDVLVLGASRTPPHSIEPYKNYDEAQSFLQMWQKRIKEAEEHAAKAYEESVQQQEEYQREMEEIGEGGTDITTKRAGVSIDPFKPILFPLQQNLMMVCRYLRHVKFIVTWEECYISFWVTMGFILLSFVCFFVPWFFLIKWSCRIIVWTVFGPWMKLVDVFYVSKIKPLTELEQNERKQRKREQHLRDFTVAVSTARINRENAKKLKAMKKHMFGKYIIRVPVLKEDRYRDLPLPESSAEPYRPGPRPLSELAMEEVGYHKTRLPGQHLEGDMIPRVSTDCDVPGS